MCGIVAEHRGSDPEALEWMLEQLTRRGPDDDGRVETGDAWLGHRRLSIVDVEGGRQPLATGDPSLYLVGNGEVYNHREIRAGPHPRAGYGVRQRGRPAPRGRAGPRRPRPAQRDVRVRHGRRRRDVRRRA